MFGITPVHLHLLINHLPVVGSIASVLLLLFAILRRNAELKRTALLAFVITAISAYATDATGDGAAHVARQIPGVSRQAIHEHSEAGDTAMDASIVDGLIALVALILAWRKPGGEQTIGDYVRHHKEPNQWLIVATLIVGLVQIYYVSVAAYEGGLIRHPEIQSGYVVPVPGGTNGYVVPVPGGTNAPVVPPIPEPSNDTD